VPEPEIAPIRAAVACILWRPRPGSAAGLEVYLGRRAPALAFGGGTWTFPGGRIEGSESLVEGAVREIEEELGIVLPATPDSYGDAGRWITPPVSPIRFDAQYFLVPAPEGADPDWRASDGELDDGGWFDPAETLARWGRGELLVMSPVRRALEALVDGIEGADVRCQRAAEIENVSPRLWELAAAVALSPLRTPTLPPATHTNCYVVGDEELVVIDPASPYAEDRDALDEALDRLAADGRRVVEIWLTHHHGDHVGGAAHLAARLGVPIRAHQHTAELLANTIPGIEAIADGEVRVLAGAPERRLRPVFTPGHAPGHLCFLEEVTGFLIAGDMVAGVGTILIDPSEGDMGRYLDSLARMKGLQPRALLPAHGGAIADPEARLDHYTEHRLWREERVVDALRSHGPGTPAELVPVAYADVPAQVYPLAERSLIAHLRKLESDGRARRGDDRWALE
jgi:glyoxylase-like metal-dependent hydrolase (beta-lactamase superfamily II)/8-oxo-dGTP pyrophosphatase MutT (NUDIX family)